MKKLQKDNKGFTLVELIVVIAILGVLAAVLVPQYIKYVEKSRAGTDIATLGEALHSAEIKAALDDSNSTSTTSFTMSMTSGVITVDTKLTDTLGSSITLKSNAGKLLTNTKLKIDVSDGKAVWNNDTTTGDTTAIFPTVSTASK